MKKNLTWNDLKAAVQEGHVRKPLISKETKEVLKKTVKTVRNAGKAAGSAIAGSVPATRGGLEKATNFTDEALAVHEVRLRQIEDALIEAGLMTAEAVEVLDDQEVSDVFEALKTARKAKKGKEEKAAEPEAENPIIEAVLALKDLVTADKTQEADVAEEKAEEKPAPKKPAKTAPKKNAKPGHRLRLDFDKIVES